MAEKPTLTVVVNVFDDKYCDVYFFTPDQKKYFSSIMNNETFQSFVKESMHYPLFNTKQDNPSINLKELVRKNLNHFTSFHNMSIHLYLDFPQTYSLEPAFDIDGCLMDEVFVCDYRIGKLYDCTGASSWLYRVPKLYRSDEFVCDDDCAFHLLQEDLEDVVSTVIRCGDELETFAELSLYAVKDDRGIEVCPFSVGNKDYFVQKAREHAGDKNYLTHKTYVYEYKKGKTTKVYGCCKFRDSFNVVALDVEKEDVCSKEDNQDSNSSVYTTDAYVTIVRYNDSGRTIRKDVWFNEDAARQWCTMPLYYSSQRFDIESYELYKVQLDMHTLLDKGGVKQ